MKVKGATHMLWCYECKGSLEDVVSKAVERYREKYGTPARCEIRAGAFEEVPAEVCVVPIEEVQNMLRCHLAIYGG